MNETTGSTPTDSTDNESQFQANPDQQQVAPVTTSFTLDFEEPINAETLQAQLLKQLKGLGTCQL